MCDQHKHHSHKINNTNKSNVPTPEQRYLTKPPTEGFLVSKETGTIFTQRGTQKAAKISSKNSFVNWVHSLHTELMNASHFTNLFTNSCDRISTYGKAPLHSRINHNSPIRSDEGLTLEKSDF